jgi:hypothetical protein
MANQPVVYRVESLVPSTVVQSAELRPEQLEEIPYDLGAAPDSGWPPAGFTGTTVTTTSTPVGTASLLPKPYNIEWVQGDTAVFQWLFTDVLWTDIDPAIDDPDAPVWEQRHWDAQVRNPYIYSTYAADFWVPAYGYQYNWWRGHSIVAAFTCTTDVVSIDPLPETPLVPRWATRVTMTLAATDSANILPGNWYRWDLQTRTAANAVKTHLRGKTRIITEWTVA